MQSDSVEIRLDIVSGTLLSENMHQSTRLRIITIEFYTVSGKKSLKFSVNNF